MDFFVLDETEFNRYRDQEEFHTYPDLYASEETNPMFSGRLSPGDYHIVFDNTSFTGGDPNGAVEANYTVRVTR
jgi:hypothetical protein